MTMNYDKLYLIKPDFPDQGRTYYCPGCAELIGVIEFYPKLKQHIEIRWVNFARPRLELVDLLGPDHQSCPVLVLRTVPKHPHTSLKVQYASGHAFVAGAREIGEYLAHIRDIGLPH